MHYGAHLPLIDFDGRGWSDGLSGYVEAARRLGYAAVSANDHLVFARPWLDGIVALASVIGASGDLRLATTISLPVVRGPVALAKAAAALDILSGGRLILGVGPGSSAADYELAGVPFDERWQRFEAGVRLLRAELRDGGTALRPAPEGPDGPPIWVASWGSAAGLRRVARVGDGWIGSAYNTTPQRLAEARKTLAAHRGGDLTGFACALATMWTFVTEDHREAAEHLVALGAMLRRPVEELAPSVLIGPSEHCAAILASYAEAGVDHVFIWPLGDTVEQLERFMRDVVPLVPSATGG
jgi:alkanesulfonate monooxygenase SsuD/methylene tetrahydromethanopterin reductase-like flavin-dependent oxidoreductase (luciferase family)